MRVCIPQARLSAMPNAGYPEAVGGRVMYPASAEYFGDYALTLQATGARIVGGCCGSGPEHIAAMRRALDAAAEGQRELPFVGSIELINGERETPLPADGPTDFSERLVERRFTV